MSIPDMNAQGPLRINPSRAIWTLARELVDQQRSIVEIERRLAAMRAKHAENLGEISSLTSEPKSAGDLIALQQLWYSKLLPSTVAKIAFTLEVYETYGDRDVSIDDPFDADLWRSKYLNAVNQMTPATPPG